MIDEFEKAEISGRNKALVVLKSIESIFSDGFDDYTISPTGDGCQWDFEIRENGSNQLLGVIEAKDRKFPSYDSRLLRQGAQMEELKYYALKSQSMRKSIPSFFLCTFTDNKYYIWDVEESNVSEDDRMCNKTTAVLSEKVKKHCFYFKLNEAKFTGGF